MSVPQLADLLLVLPHDDKEEMLSLLPEDQAARIRRILSERESTARTLVSADYLALPKEAKVGETLASIRASGRDYHNTSYIYVVGGPEKILLGVVDLRELVLASDDKTLGDIMASPVVAAEEDDTRDDLAELFLKYHYRMIPVVDDKDRLLGIIHHNDIVKGLSLRART